MPAICFANRPSFKTSADDDSICSMVSISFANDDALNNPSISLQPQIKNRIISRNPERFIHISFANLSFDAFRGNKKAIHLDFVKNVLEQGVEIEGQLYLYCGHSNSQLKSRSCFLYAARGHCEVTRMVNKLGDFYNIKSIGKRAKRIGLLFSGYDFEIKLDIEQTTEIEDVERHGKNFTDGCGMIRRKFASEIMIKINEEKENEEKQTRPVTATATSDSPGTKPPLPSVFQIRYKGYKGILMTVGVKDITNALSHLKPSTSAGHYFGAQPTYNSSTSKFTCVGTPNVLFRKSMRKFGKCPKNAFCIVEYSKPGGPAKLNAELVSVLSTLGIPDKVFEEKQMRYFKFIRDSSRNIGAAIRFLEYRQRYDTVRRLKALLPSFDINTNSEQQGNPDLNSLGSNSILREIKELQKNELKHNYDKYDLEKVHIMIPRSRLLYGVCDITRKLYEGQCFVKITIDRNTHETLTLKGPILVGRNPCLHPGDIQMFNAVENIPELEQFVDCIVFSTRGKLPPASQMSGGDLDGDKFFVSWDKDIYPRKTAPALDYTVLAPQMPQNSGEESAMIDYFVNYSTSLGDIMNLYWRWIRASPTEKAFCKECVQLNELYSQCVDGGEVDVPKSLRSGLKNQAPASTRFVLDILKENLRKYLDGKFDECLGESTRTTPRVTAKASTSHQHAKTTSHVKSVATRSNSHKTHNGSSSSHPSISKQKSGTPSSSARSQLRRQNENECIIA